MLVIPRLLPCRDFSSQRLGIRNPPVQALTAEDRELDLDHVEPGGVLGRVVERQLLREPPGLWCREGGVERSGGVGVQVIDHKSDACSVGELLVDEPPDHLGDVLLAMMVGDEHVAPCTPGTEDNEETFRATSFVLIVVACCPTGTWWDRSNDVTEELVRAFIEADNRMERIVRLSIEIKDVFHAPEEVRSDFTQAPLPLLPRLEPVFF